MQSLYGFQHLASTFLKEGHTQDMFNTKKVAAARKLWITAHEKKAQAVTGEERVIAASCQGMLRVDHDSRDKTTGWEVGDVGYLNPALRGI